MGLNFKNKKLFYKKTLLLHFNTSKHTQSKLNFMEFIAQYLQSITSLNSYSLNLVLQTSYKKK